MGEIEQLLVTKTEAAQTLRISMRKLDYLVQEGKLKATRIGKRVLFSPHALAELAKRGAK